MRPRSWWSWERPILSASSMMRVFTLGMSMPVSMMVVHTSTSICPSDISVMVALISSWVILPWATGR